MKINSGRINKKRVLVITVLVLLVGCGIAYSLVLSGKHDTQTQTKVPTPPTTAQVKTRQQTESSEKQSYIEEKGSAAVTAAPAPVPTSPDTISLSAKKTSSTEVTIFTSLNGYSGGECKLDITNGDKTYTKTVQIIYQPEASSCAGYTVPYSALGSGQWSISLTVTPAGGSPIAKKIVEQE